MDHRDHLFVYGTLMRRVGQPMNRLLSGRSAYVGTGWWRGRLYDVGAYPAAVPSDDDGARVAGEVYRLYPNSRNELLHELDAYEDCDPVQPDSGLYRRERHTVNANGRPVSAWVYVYNRPVEDLSAIPSGDYAAYLLRSGLRPG